MISAIPLIRKSNLLRFRSICGGGQSGPPFNLHALDETVRHGFSAEGRTEVRIPEKGRSPPQLVHDQGRGKLYCPSDCFGLPWSIIFVRILAP